MGGGREVPISLEGLRDKNLMQLKKLNTALFPVRYNDKYYADALSSADFTKLGYDASYGSYYFFINSSTLINLLVILKRHSFDFSSAYYGDICVGSIACRLEKKEAGAVRVYIMTLGVLAPYRGLGIGEHATYLPFDELLYRVCLRSQSTRLLNHVLELCSKQNISETYLHVQTNNEDAINFYKKFGFEITDTIKNYYTNITPPDCYVVTKYITQSKK
ncbi:n-alpha-acetyltransferase 50 [Quercus suber]|uniref:N-alpha-acetyltransferase 50 n=1 Tax=Quercus suber TaxID=58331 RepID=A0AAW0KK85_QUESU